VDIEEKFLKYVGAEVDEFDKKKNNSGEEVKKPE
jgi:hypothetical protein